MFDKNLTPIQKAEIRHLMSIFVPNVQEMGPGNMFSKFDDSTLCRGLFLPLLHTTRQLTTLLNHVWGLLWHDGANLLVFSCTFRIFKKCFLWYALLGFFRFSSNKEINFGTRQDGKVFQAGQEETSLKKSITVALDLKPSGQIIDEKSDRKMNLF